LLCNINKITESKDIQSFFAGNLASSHTRSTNYLDSGATQNYYASVDVEYLLEVSPTTKPITISLPNGDSIVSTHTGLLNLPNLPYAARQVDIFPHLKHSLISLGHLCDSDLHVITTKHAMTIYNANKTVLGCAKRDPTTKLYAFDFSATVPSKSMSPPPPINHHAYNIEGLANLSIYQQRTDQQLVAFYHACMGYPSLPTFLKAVSKGFLQFPGLTYQKAAKHLPDSINTSKGHLRLRRQGIRSTKESAPDLAIIDLPDPETDDDLHPVPVQPTTRPKIHVKLVDTSTIHVDACYHHIKATSGTKYILVTYSEEGNYIHFTPMSNLSKEAYVAAYTEILTFFRSAPGRIHPNVVRLDNQTSDMLEKFLTMNDIQPEYVPPGDHRASKAERAIQTAEAHITSHLAGADIKFDEREWDRCLPAMEHTLNMLRQSGVCNSISAWQQLHGAYDYDAHPIGPLGCRVLCYTDASTRPSFVARGIEGFYIGHSKETYRAFQVYIPSTRSIRVTTTLSWHPSPHWNIPVTSVLNDLQETIATLTTLLGKCLTTPAGTTQLPAISPQHASDAIRSLQALFQNASTPPTTLFPSIDPATIDSEPETVPTQRVVDPKTPDLSNQRVVDPKTPDLSNQRVVDPAPIVPNQRVTRSTTATKNTIVHKILSHQTINHRLMFRVQWHNNSAKNATWEHIHTLADNAVFHNYCKARPKLHHLLTTAITPSPTANSVINDPLPSTKRLDEIDMHLALSAYQEPRFGYSYDLTGLPDYKDPMYIPPLIGFADTSDIENDPHFAFAAGDINIDGEQLRYRQCVKGPDGASWTRAYHEEIVRLVENSKSIEFISTKDLPNRKIPSYFNPQCKIKTTDAGERIFRVRGTFGGDKSTYDGPRTAHVAEMTTVKILINRTISDPKRKAVTADIVDYYLHSKLDKGNEVYMYIKVSDMPEFTQKHFNIQQYLEPGQLSVLVRVLGGLYGMPEAGYLAQQKLIPILATKGFVQCKSTPCLFIHPTRDIEFTLVVDDFFISYAHDTDANFLLDTLRSTYPLKVNWSANKYIGFDIEWNYSHNDLSNRFVALSMLGYIAAALIRFNFHPTSNTYTPEPPVPISYGKNTSQLTPDEDTSAPLSPAEITRLQQIIGTVLYYARGVDGTILCPVSRTASRQVNATRNVLDSAHRILAYCATYPNATIVYHPSDMILKVCSDASYNSETKGRSRAANFKFLGRANDRTFINGPIECISTVIPTVVSAASEAEYAGAFIAGQGSMSLRYTLDEINCIQPATPLYTDNKTAAGIATKTCRQKRSKSMDMRYHWIRDRVALKDFDVQWTSNTDSLIKIADFLSKPHSNATFTAMRPFFVQPTAPAFCTKASRRKANRALP